MLEKKTYLKHHWGCDDSSHCPSTVQHTIILGNRTQIYRFLIRQDVALIRTLTIFPGAEEYKGTTESDVKSENYKLKQCVKL